MQITLRNDYHNTTYSLRVHGPLSPQQIIRCRKALCGVASCSCGGPLGERGPQPVQITMEGSTIILAPRPAPESVI